MLRRRPNFSMRQQSTGEINDAKTRMNGTHEKDKDARNLCGLPNTDWSHTAYTYPYGIPSAGRLRLRKIIKIDRTESVLIMCSLCACECVQDEFILRFKIALGHVINDIKTHFA